MIWFSMSLGFIIAPQQIVASPLPISIVKPRHDSITIHHHDTRQTQHPRNKGLRIRASKTHCLIQAKVKTRLWVYIVPHEDCTFHIKSCLCLGMWRRLLPLHSLAIAGFKTLCNFQRTQGKLWMMNVTTGMSKREEKKNLSTVLKGLGSTC